MEIKFIISDVAEDTIEPVNIDNIFTFRKRDTNRSLSGETKFYIDFYKSEPNLKHEPITWKYKSQSDRNCDYQKIIDKVAVSVNEL